MKAAQFIDFDDFRDSGQAGSICFMENVEAGVQGFGIKCAGCGHESYLTVDGESHGWKWDGNREHPTLTPSVFHTKEKGGCGWHGYLRSGEWVPV